MEDERVLSFVANVLVCKSRNAKRASQQQASALSGFVVDEMMKEVVLFVCVSVHESARECGRRR